MTMKTQTMNRSSPYYQVSEDLKAYPEAWAYVIVGGRNTGKTYGALKYYLEEKVPLVFIKRCNDDVDTLCAGNQLGKTAADYEVDLSPYKSINRDLGTSIKAYKIKTGLGGFYKTGEDGAYGSPVAYLASLNAVQKIKGFDMSECESMVFDEFIPQPWERISRKEGEQLMDLYKTVSRDRVLRGRPELKLICLANAVNVWNPTCEILGLTDLIADMSIRGTETYYDEERGIFVRILKTSGEMMEAEEKTGVYKAMKDTQWGRMAFSNEFGYNDFSKVKKVPLKGYRPYCQILYKEKSWTLYQNDDAWYLSKSPASGVKITYNLNEETQQKLFYYDVVIDLWEAAISGKAYFQTYSMYDLILNYKRRFIVT